MNPPEQPSGRPGARLPHRWIEEGGARLSTLDLADRRFVLLAGPDGHAWIAAGHRNGGLSVSQIREEAFLTDAGISAQGALLLRPDGVIGWRCMGEAGDPDAALTEALRRLSAR